LQIVVEKNRTFSLGVISLNANFSKTQTYFVDFEILKTKILNKDNRQVKNSDVLPKFRNKLQILKNFNSLNSLSFVLHHVILVDKTYR
jgi:hypothetical protein